MSNRHARLRYIAGIGAPKFAAMTAELRALLDERDELLEALAGLLDTCRTVNDAQQRQVVDPHEMQIAERVIARAEGGEKADV